MSSRLNELNTEGKSHDFVDEHYKYIGDDYNMTWLIKTWLKHDTHMINSNHTQKTANWKLSLELGHYLQETS